MAGEGPDVLDLSASAPALPPLGPSVSFSPAVDAAAKQRAVREQRRARQAVEAPRRRAFLQGLINEDLANLSKWHGSRPHHEQKRFLNAVDSLYSQFSKVDGNLPALQAQATKQAKQFEQQQAMEAAEAAAQIALAKQLSDDPYVRESPRRLETLPALGESASAPNLPSKPIDVFEQNKRRGLGKKGGSTAGSDAGSVTSSQATKNGLERWMDAMSMGTTTTGASSATRITTLSQMTRTSDGTFSNCSEPGTTNQAHFRVHKRAIALNKRDFNAKDQHEPSYLKDGVPNMGFPECERMATAFRDAFGHKPLGGGEIPKNSYSSVLQAEKLPFVDKFLEGANSEEKNQVGGMVRSLQYLRTAHKRRTVSLQKQEMDLYENQRLWKPARQKSVFEPDQRNFSRVPLGSLGMPMGKKKIAEEERPETPGIHSPSVSGLGSLPLTPRSLPTPLVGGTDFPLMSQPPGLMEALAPIAEAC